MHGFSQVVGFFFLYHLLCNSVNSITQFLLIFPLIPELFGNSYQFPSFFALALACLSSVSQVEFCKSLVRFDNHTAQVCGLASVDGWRHLLLVCQVLLFVCLGILSCINWEPQALVFGLLCLFFSLCCFLGCKVQFQVP